MTDINGVKYCAKQGGRSFKDSVRPVRKGNSTATGYECPDGYSPCNPNALETMDTLLYVNCYHEAGGETVDDNCPITDISFRQGMDRIHQRTTDFRG